MLTILFFIFSFVSSASDFHSPRTASLGGAGHAGPLLNDSIYLNPSFISFSPTQSFSFNYLSFRGGQLDNDQGISDYYGRNLNASIYDGSEDTLFQAGVGYTRRDDANMVHVGASKAFVKRWGVGIGAKMIFPRNGTGSRINDVSLSFSGIFNSFIQGSLILDNLLGSGANDGFRRELILGTKISVNRIVYVYLDPHYEENTRFGYEAGIEFQFLYDLFLRAGIFRNATAPFQVNLVGSQSGRGYSGGLGWLAPKLSLDYGYYRVLDIFPAHSHHFGLTIYF